MKKLLAILLVSLALCGPAFAQEAGKKDSKKQFVYVLKLSPRLLDEKNWTERDKQIVGRHFRRLQQMQKDGRLILAGKTLDDADPSQFGVVVFEAETEEEARGVMEADDAVKEKIMTARLFPFRVALAR
ncbi:MAG: YciI family protein [Acidobacteria bacterium]|nr:YciI family protein [Acidobacteriota bacterium]